MNTIDRLTTAADSFMSEFAAVIADLHTTANTQRKALLAIIADMQGTQMVLDGVSTVAAEVAEVMEGLACDCDELNAKIGDAIDDPADACPDCNCEDLVGYCENCGEALTSDTCVMDDDGNLYCNECAPEQEEEEEAEDQLEMDIPLADSVEQ